MNRFFHFADNILLTIKYHWINFDIYNFLPSIYTVPLLSPYSSTISINELMKDGILWGVPKKKRNVERKIKRRFGIEKYPDCAPILRPRNDLIICERCGDHHEFYAICPTCYQKVKEETEKIKADIKKQINPLMPKEKEIFLKFKNEEYTNDINKFQIIEIDRPRPDWFSKNLLSKSTGVGQNSKDLILDPKDLIAKNNEK